MGKLIYFITTTLDGYIADENGNFDFTFPTEDDLAFVNRLFGGVGTLIFGKHMYETMKVWDTFPLNEDSPGVNEFAQIWKNADKIVYSRTLSEVSTKNTKLERVLVAEKIHEVIARSPRDISIGGPHLAGEAMRAGLVQEIHQVIAPVMIGSGNYWLPRNFKCQLELVDSQKFANGKVHLHYRPIKA